MRRYALITFGCQMNTHDSERMAEVLDASGYRAAATLEDADLILLNTCSVREKAEQKLRSEIGRLTQLKRRRPELLLGIAGCVAQQEGERLLKRMPGVDLVLGPDNIAELPEMLAGLELGGAPRVRAEFDLDEPQFLTARTEPLAATTSARATTAFVTVMKGCNERCSFCIVPHTRGPERYRPAREILDEVARLAASGVSEITLLGQTVNSYRDPLAELPPAPGAGDSRWRQTRGSKASEDETEFPALLRAIHAGTPQLQRLRYTSPHPRHLTVSLIRAHQELPLLPRHVHLPVQSGSDRVLKRMLRRYSIAEYNERVAALAAAVPEMTFSTDIIVGFPGESAEDFAATLELVERIGFVGLFGFKYSPRPYTPAIKLEDDVSEAEKSERLERLFAVCNARRTAYLAARVGQTESVLCEGLGRVQTSERASYTGRTEHNQIVHFESPFDATGMMVQLRVLEAFKNSLRAELLDAAERPTQVRRSLKPGPHFRSLPVLR